MKKQAIVNLATRPFRTGQNRLEESLKNRFEGEVFTFHFEGEVDAPSHLENPYAFKVYAIEKVRSLGYDQILWLDGSVFAVQPVSPVFDWIEQHGVFMEEAGHWAGSWCPENVREYFGVSREAVKIMPMFSAGFTGIDFTNPVGVKFFEAWKKSMEDGMFKGSWTDHRHDMTCGSIIANLQGLDKFYSKGGNYFSYIGAGYSQPQNSVIFHVQGI
jgi:hypothetical protein